ncbi:MAG: DNA polymerase III subunit chi [Pseudomonadota bacterium]
MAAEDAPPANGARFLLLIDGATTTRAADYDRVLDLFDGNDEAATTAARARWAAAKAAGHTLSYLKQGAQGWEKG